MPVERQPAAQKRRRLPFNPPRPRASASAEASTSASKSKSKTISRTSTASASKSTNKSASSRRRSPSPPSRSASPASDSASESGSDSASARSERSLSQEPDYIIAEIIDDKSKDVHSSDPTIPPKLLTRILHHHFQSDKTKIAKDANLLVAKYVDIFVREALARAAYERAESEGNRNAGRSIGDGFLEV